MPTYSRLQVLKIQIMDLFKYKSSQSWFLPKETCQIDAGLMNVKLWNWVVELYKIYAFHFIFWTRLNFFSSAQSLISRAKLFGLFLFVWFFHRIFASSFFTKFMVSFLFEMGLTFVSLIAIVCDVNKNKIPPPRCEQRIPLETYTTGL